MDFVILRDEAERARSVSDMVVADGWAFINNVLPVDLDNDRAALPEYVEEQTRKILANLEAILARIGATRSDVASVRVCLTNFEAMFKRFDGAYAGFFDPARQPTRSCIGVTHLTRSAQVAMDFVVRVAR